MSRVGPNFADVDTKPTVPLSPETFDVTDVPSNWSAFDSASPLRVFVPSLNSAAVSDATPCRPAGSNWSSPPRNVIENEISGRSCFSETISSAPLAKTLRLHAGT
jgi:hypothetical protein